MYCNDRSTTNGQTWTATGTDTFSYDPAYRAGQWLESNGWTSFKASLVSPTLKCTNAEDKFSKGTSAGGNGYLTYPIAMMTSDEVIFSGGRFHAQSYSWYYYASDNMSDAVTNKWWWLMSPFYKSNYVTEFYVDDPQFPGYLAELAVNNNGGLRPVISLKADVLWESGDGSAANPYRIKMNYPTLTEKMLSDNTNLETRTTFGTELNGTDKRGTLYYTNLTEDGSNVYYYAGTQVNNWVVFGKCASGKNTEDETDNYNCVDGTNLYWRIIRTNTASEGGGVRLLYFGSGSAISPIPATSNGYTRNIYKRIADNNISLFGYFSSGVNSLEQIHENNNLNFAKFIEPWYNKTMKDKYNNYINKQAIYCNDRSYVEKSNNYVNFGGHYRMEENKNPSLKCGVDQNNTLMSTSDERDKLTGLGAATITADEASFAGMSYYENTKIWLVTNANVTSPSDSGNQYIPYDGSMYTMTPNFWSSAGRTHIFAINASDEKLTYETTYFVKYISPVISLKSNVTVESGDGSASSPYVIHIDGR